MSTRTGAQVIAQALYDLGVTVLFGIVGIPVVEIAEEAINLGIRFLGFRNEQAASYAASAYGYLTGRPGVCLVVGGPGVLHAIPGIGNSSVNAFPLLLLAGSSETYLVSKGAFQEMDAISILTPYTKWAIRTPTLNSIPDAIRNAYRASCFGRPGTSFVDFPADIIQGTLHAQHHVEGMKKVGLPPRGGAEEEKLRKVATVLKDARAPLVVIGKGAAYARAENAIREFIDRTSIPFLSTPMGRGVVPDSHPRNVSSARSTALRQADVVLVLGARLNWILHFGEAPKWNPQVRFIQVDISAAELGRNAGDPEFSILGDITIVMNQLTCKLDGWSWEPNSSNFTEQLEEARWKNESAAAKKAHEDTLPMTYARTFAIIRSTLEGLSPPDEGGIAYVSEGANTMDISRSIFRVEHPRLRLDAGTHSTMGIGLGYAIAAHVAYNTDCKQKRKKIVALEGDSAFGFSGMEMETMARYKMDILTYVINNGGIYHGDASPPSSNTADDLRSTSLGWEIGYEKMAEGFGGKGYLVRTPEELEKATVEGFHADIPVLVNVLIEKGAGTKLEFGWQASSRKARGGKETKL
ncbi:MAG: hypothetical protein M1816_002208 [Peltula sp. TS41687]|nr:MAG: hypothetical protein M1816_002208 [Peltula sp. TS41687]